MTKINSNQGITTNQTKPKKVKEKGSFRAFGTGTLASMSLTPVSLLAVNGIQKINKKMTPEQFAKINDSIDKILISSGLSNKGVNINNITLDSFGSELPKSPLMDMLFPDVAVAKGKNAYFRHKNCLTKEIDNVITINREKLPTAAFHEMGHAFNANSSKFWGAMQKMRTPAMALSSYFLLFSAFSRNEVAEEGKELTKVQKAKNFVRNNSGILAFSTMLPVIAEEVAASVRGCKWANSNLPKELAKKVRNTNLLGGITYIGAAVGMGLAAHFAVKTKDKIMEKENNPKKEIQNETLKKAIS